MADTDDLDDDLREEYDLSDLTRRGGRGPYAERYRAGTNLVLLDADVAAVFQSDEAVNKALRTLIDIARQQVPKAS
jgi:hypothetical protein